MRYEVDSDLPTSRISVDVKHIVLDNQEHPSSELWNDPSIILAVRFIEEKLPHRVKEHSSNLRLVC